MAFLQPENIPSRNDIPRRLQIVARALRDRVSDDVTVRLKRTGSGQAVAVRHEYDPEHNPRPGSETAPYLVLLDPEAGIAVIEAPAVSRRRRGRLRTKDLDADQVRAEVAKQTTLLRRGLDAASLAALPVIHIIALPETPRREVSNLRLGGQQRILCRDDLESDDLRPVLQQLIGGRRLPLTHQAETAARTVVNPAILIGRNAQQSLLFRSPDDEKNIRALDRDQERVAEHLGPGYRLIRGVAGSGKTLILTHRAKYIAKHLPEWRILLVCYNRALATALGEEVRNFGNVTAQTVGQRANAIKQIRQQPGEQNDVFYDRQIREALQTVKSLAESNLYDVVLVDEAQDLDKGRLDLAWASLKHGRDHFVIALDSAQNVYRRRMTWNPPGTDAQGRKRTARGRSTVLKINYRNTREILDRARGVLPGDDPPDRSESDPDSPTRPARRPTPPRDPTDAAEADPDRLDIFVEPEAAVRRGQLPQTLACADLAAEVEAIAREVRKLRDAGIKPEHIVVLSGWPKLRQMVLREIPDALDAKQYAVKAVLARDKVRVATLHWAKGLEFRHVIVGGANHTWVPEDEEAMQREHIRRLLYVAMTRATQTLTVTHSGTGPMDTISSGDLPVIDPKDFGTADA